MKYSLIIFSFFLLNISVKSQTPIKIWETEPVFSGPESVVYDPVRELLYAGNFRKEKKSNNCFGEQFISKIGLDGKIIELEWIKGITEATGISIFNDQLYIVERYGISIYDLKTNNFSKRIRINTLKFINDVSVGNDSTIYVSESNTDIIYCIKNNETKIWISDNKIMKPNGVSIDGNFLLVGVNNDSSLVSINLENKEIRKIAQMQNGIIDGIKTIENDYLVSFFEGILYRVTKSGEITELLNTRNTETNIADFEYIASKKMLIVPALWNHKIIAYRLD